MKEVTRERLEEIVSDPMINQGSEFAMMARMALATMEAEPVAWISQSNLDALSRGHDALVKSTDNVVQPVPLYRHAQPAPVVPDDVQRDAKRWRALLGSARIRILGSAGFDATAHPGENPDYRHFGMEIWTHYPNWLHEKNEYGIDTLTQYADACRAAMLNQK